MVCWSLALLLGVLATAAIPQALANVWLSVNRHSQTGCGGQVVAFTNTDFTYMFDTAGLGPMAKALAAAAALVGLKLEVPTSMRTCADVKAFATLYTQMNTAKSTVNETQVDLSAIVGATASTSTSVSVSSSASGAVADEMLGNLTTLLNGGCLTTTNGRLHTSLSCVVADGPPPLPRSNNVFAVEYYANFTSCSYDKAYSVRGVVADGRCYDNGGTSNNVPLCTSATCEGLTTLLPNITQSTSASAGVYVSVTSESKRQCQVEAGVRTQTICKAGTGAAGGGVSLVATTMKEQKTWAARSNQTNKFGGNLGLSLRAQADVKVNVTVAPRPVTAESPPSRGFNTYYYLEADAGASFDATLMFTYTDDDLNKFGYAANSLKWAVYNTATKAWEAKGESKVDVSAKTVVHTTSSFSEWAVVASGALALGPSIAFVLGAILLTASALFM